jgi:hypothetical protein
VFVLRQWLGGWNGRNSAGALPNQIVSEGEQSCDRQSRVEEVGDLNDQIYVSLTAKPISFALADEARRKGDVNQQVDCSVPALAHLQLEEYSWHHIGGR